MAVIIQRMVGSRHGDRFYPTSPAWRVVQRLSLAAMKSDDGVAAVRWGSAAPWSRATPACASRPVPAPHPRGSSADVLLKTRTRVLRARPVARRVRSPGRRGPSCRASARGGRGRRHAGRGRIDLVAREPCDHDGLARPGVRLVTFAPILKHGVFPLADVLHAMLDSGPLRHRLGGRDRVRREPVGARRLPAGVRLPADAAARGRRRHGTPRPERAPAGEVLCRSDAVLGHGRINDVRDLVVVDQHRYDGCAASRSPSRWRA